VASRQPQRQADGASYVITGESSGKPAQGKALWWKAVTGAFRIEGIQHNHRDGQKQEADAAKGQQAQPPRARSD
jgi:hypothetical protein